MVNNIVSPFKVISVIIVARNEGPRIAETVRAVIHQSHDGLKIDVIVVDDGSSDNTAEAASNSGARVISTGNNGPSGSPGAGRNLGAVSSKGDPMIFLDADCIISKGWLNAILSAHEKGATVVGGSLEIPKNLPAMARCDYYCGWYLIHPKRPAGFVPHHPPPNLSVRRKAFFETSGFSEQPPLNYTNEERLWQSELQKRKHRIYFEPKAVAFHFNRPGFGNLLRRNYRWGYTAIEIKFKTRATRMAWLYRFPLLLIMATPFLAVAHSVYILKCWLQAGRFEPVIMLPIILLSRFAYGFGMAVGGIKWLRHCHTPIKGHRPPPRWI
jgi:glycosyltransferase involved in cell wall biosynthesis